MASIRHPRLPVKPQNAAVRQKSASGTRDVYKRQMQDGYIINSWVNYTHQRSWLQYPAMTAMEKRMTNSWNDAGAFMTVQDALQFYPTNEGVEMIK